MMCPNMPEELTVSERLPEVVTPTGLHSQQQASRLEALNQALLRPIDEAFQAARRQFPDVLPCARGCSRCCVSYFEISLADVWRLAEGLQGIAPEIRRQLRALGMQRLKTVQEWFPFWAAPWDARELGPGMEQLAEREVLSCPALDARGGCWVYEARPRICRLQGLGFEEPGNPEVRLEDGCAEVFGSEEYRGLPAFPLELVEQWRLEAELRREVREVAWETLPEGMDGGFRTFVAGALVLLVDEDGEVKRLFGQQNGSRVKTLAR